MFEERKDEVIIDSCGTMRSRVEHPDEECYFQNIVEGNKGEDYASELINDGESAKHNPVCKPLFVVILTLRF